VSGAANRTRVDTFADACQITRVYIHERLRLDYTEAVQRLSRAVLPRAGQSHEGIRKQKEGEGHQDSKKHVCA
jgi:hypothetical protein